MFIKAGTDFSIYCDYEARVIRVQEDVNPLPGFLPMFREVARFATIEEWEASKYARRVTDENVDDAISWFWIDMRPGTGG